MELSDGSELLVRKLFDYDKLCFNKCVGVPEKKFTVKEENCLSNSIIIIKKPLLLRIIIA